MSYLLDSYRRNAEASLADAKGAALPNVRARAVEVAAKWTELADRLAWVEEQGQIRSEAANQAPATAR